MIFQTRYNMTIQMTIGEYQKLRHLITQLPDESFDSIETMDDYMVTVKELKRFLSFSPIPLQDDLINSVEGTW